MILAFLFFCVALLYSSVGFGGGSSYIALLQWHGMSASALPLLSLTCNLIVSTQSFVQFSRAGLFSTRRSLPFVMLSVPAAYLGGLYAIKETTFLILLTASLTAAGVLLLFPGTPEQWETVTGQKGMSGITMLRLAGRPGVGIGFGDGFGASGFCSASRSASFRASWESEAGFFWLPSSI